MNRRRLAQIVISAIVAVDLVALSASALHRTTTTTVQHRRAAVLAAAPPTQRAAARSASAPAPALPPAAAFPVAAGVNSPATATPTATTPPASTTTPPAGTSTPPVVTEAADCPIPLQKPATNGGLQSLIGFAPAFGPFSAEAFAMASAYQPLLQLLGPVLAQFPALEAKAQPEIDEFLKPWENVLNAAFAVLSPLYTPYRSPVLSAETKFAAFLAPYAESLATSPLGGCLVDVEAALVGDVQKNSAQKNSAQKNDVQKGTTPSVVGRLAHS